MKPYSPPSEESFFKKVRRLFSQSNVYEWVGLLLATIMSVEPASSLLDKLCWGYLGTFSEYKFYFSWLYVLACLFLFWRIVEYKTDERTEEQKKEEKHNRAMKSGVFNAKYFGWFLKLGPFIRNDQNHIRKFTPVLTREEGQTSSTLKEFCAETKVRDQG